MAVTFECKTTIEASQPAVFDLSLSVDAHLESMAGSNELAIAGVTTGSIGLGEEVTWRAVHYGAAFGAAMLLQRTAPLDMPGRPTTALVGAVILIAGLALDLAGVATVIAHRTTIVPHRPVAKLITSGIYRFSRNPMYTGLAIMVAGGALISGSWWPLITLPLALLAVRELAIKPEETYLTERYGPIYADYRRRVRRWL